IERGRSRRRPSRPTRNGGEHLAGFLLYGGKAFERRRPTRFVRGGQFRRVGEVPPALMRIDQLGQALALAEREEIADDDGRAVPRVAGPENLASLVLFAQKRRAARREDAFDQRLDEIFVAL